MNDKVILKLCTDGADKFSVIPIDMKFLQEIYHKARKMMIFI